MERSPKVGESKRKSRASRAEFSATKTVSCCSKVKDCSGQEQGKALLLNNPIYLPLIK